MEAEKQTLKKALRTEQESTTREERPSAGTAEVGADQGTPGTPAAEAPEAATASGSRPCSRGSGPCRSRATPFLRRLLCRVKDELLSVTSDVSPLFGIFCKGLSVPRTFGWCFQGGREDQTI